MLGCRKVLGVRVLKVRVLRVLAVLGVLGAPMRAEAQDPHAGMQHDMPAASGWTFMQDGVGFAMYNDQGFLMQLLDPTVPGLFRINQGDSTTSNVLTYWRHEFRTYKAAHRLQDNYLADDDDPNWHADGSYHVNHDTIVVAIRGTLPNGTLPTPGATPKFRLGVTSQPAAQLN